MSQQFPSTILELWRDADTRVKTVTISWTVRSLIQEMGMSGYVLIASGWESDGNPKTDRFALVFKKEMPDLVAEGPDGPEYFYRHKERIG